MKVMCIDDKFVYIDGHEPKYGEIVTVIAECDTFQNNWDIAEYLFDSEGYRISFNKRHFIKLSDICETELAKQREELQTA